MAQGQYPPPAAQGFRADKRGGLYPSILWNPQAEIPLWHGKKPGGGSGIRSQIPRGKARLRQPGEVRHRLHERHCFCRRQANNLLSHRCQVFAKPQDGDPDNGA